MITGSFEYHRPTSVDEVVALLTTHGDTGQILAGGHSLVPMMKLRLAAPEHVIDLAGIAELGGIEEAGGEIRIGATVTQAEIIESEVIAAKAPILREAALLIADPQVRYCGTIGGNVANGDPGNDMPAVMMALGATYVLRGPKGERDVDPRSFYEAPYFTARADDEVLTLIRVPAAAAGQGSAYLKMKRKVGDYATAATAVILTLDGGKCSAASVALTNLAATPLLVEEAAAALVGGAVDDAAIGKAAEAAMAASDPVADMHGPVEFRRHMAGVMTRRAIELALSRATGG
ncbi:MAG: xanthine dehydrogenase family protein subunit M [Alphaproteobacteria bacterium]